VLTHPAALIFYALFLWWFSTGLVLFLNRRNPHSFPAAMAGGTVLFALALYGVGYSAGSTSVASTYIAFGCGLIAWAWQELSFYLGYITGPRRVLCTPGCRGPRHWGHALGVSLYHELSILITGLALFWLTWDQPNQLAFHLFVLITFMHQSARINVMLGVRNVSAHWVPAHLFYLKSFLKTKDMNPFFPISQLLALAILWILIDKAVAAPAGSFALMSATALSAMAALAIIEHWFLILPIPLTALWRWWEQREAPSSKTKTDSYPLRSIASDFTAPKAVAGDANRNSHGPEGPLAPSPSGRP
jgi:putative photosynthetic complex assembly protein 2